EPMECPQSGGATDRARSKREGHQRDGRGQGEPRPGGEPTGEAATRQPHREPHLRGRGSRQELAERDEVRVGGLAEPLSPLDELAAEVPEMRDGAAERGEAEVEEDAEDRAGGVGHRAPSTGWRWAACPRGRA